MRRLIILAEGGLLAMVVLSGAAQASTLYIEENNINVVTSPDGRTFTATANIVAGTPISHGTIEDEGEGTLSPSPQPNCLETDQTAVASDADNPGSTIKAHIVGPVCSSGDPPTNHGSGSVTIIGGTGKYAGATGGGTLTYDGSNNTGVVQGTITFEAPAKPVNTSPPSISGDAVQGQTLSALPGTWSNNPASYKYQWERCGSQGENCEDIGDATTDNTYPLTGDDSGHAIRVQVSASNAAGEGDPVASELTPVVACGSRDRYGPALGWDQLDPVFQARLNDMYDTLDAEGACYKLNETYRTNEQQQDLYDRWHEIADYHQSENHKQLCAKLHAAGFAQCPTVWKNGIAQGGPGKPGSSPHEYGLAVDITVRFPPNDQPDVAKFQKAAHEARLCGPPDWDPVHVEMPYNNKKDPMVKCHV